MSRFDLFFVIQDDKRDEQDFQIAKHIVNMHRVQEKAFKVQFNLETL